MMRRAIALLTAVVLVAGCGPQAALDGLVPAGRGRVVAAPTGDALVLADGTRVRLAGIEAPHGDEPYAEEARATLARLAVGHEVELMSGGARADGYGRVIAQARVAGRRLWLQQALLNAGAARVRTYADNRALARPMLEAEASARVARRGLWERPAYQVLLPREIEPDARGFRVIEGRVAAVARDRTWIVIDLDRRLGAEIPPTARDDFAAAGLEPRTLSGRLVRVRGPVRPTASGPRLWLDHPEQLELLTEAGAQRKTPGREAGRSSR